MLRKIRRTKEEKKNQIHSQNLVKMEKRTIIIMKSWFQVTHIQNHVFYCINRVLLFDMPWLWFFGQITNCQSNIYIKHKLFYLRIKTKMIWLLSSRARYSKSTVCLCVCAWNALNPYISWWNVCGKSLKKKTEKFIFNTFN